MRDTSLLQKWGDVSKTIYKNKIAILALQETLVKIHVISSGPLMVRWPGNQQIYVWSTCSTHYILVLLLYGA